MYNRLVEQSRERRQLSKESHTKYLVPVPKESIRWASVVKAIQVDETIKDELSTYIKRDILREAPQITTAINSDVCDHCGVQMMVIANDSMLACSRCGKTRLVTTVHAWNASMDADYSVLNLHQKSRLLEWLECAQAKEYGDIPQSVLTEVMSALARNRMTGLEDFAGDIADAVQTGGPFLSVQDAIDRLKIPGLAEKLKSIDAIMVRNVIRNTASPETKKFADRSAKIASLLSGYYPERLSADQEEYIRKLFMAASSVYERYKHNNNWPGGYAYFLRCLLILLGWDEIAAHFPVQLTGRNADREEMRASIWKVLQWENVPSVPPFRKVRLPDGTYLDGSIVASADSRCKITTRGYEELLS